MGLKMCEWRARIPTDCGQKYSGSQQMKLPRNEQSFPMYASGETFIGEVCIPAWETSSKMSRHAHPQFTMVFKISQP